MINETKEFFLPGDVVTVRQDIPNKPVMMVVRKVTKTFKSISNPNSIKTDYFQGILCRWFTTSGELQEAVYNTKDICRK